MSLFHQHLDSLRLGLKDINLAPIWNELCSTDLIRRFQVKKGGLRSSGLVGISAQE